MTPPEAMAVTESRQLTGIPSSAWNSAQKRTVIMRACDPFLGQSGKPEELIERYGIGVDSTVKAVRKLRAPD